MVQQKSLAAPAYLVAFALIAIPPVDALMQVLPMQIHETRWRFAAFGLMSNAVMVPITGLLVAFAVSAIFEHWRFQRVLGVVCAVVAVAMLALLALFVLDAFQFRSQLQFRPDAKAAGLLAFHVATATAASKALLGVITLVAFTVAAFRTPKARRTQPVSRTEIVIGAGLTAKANKPAES